MRREYKTRMLIENFERERLRILCDGAANFAGLQTGGGRLIRRGGARRDKTFIVREPLLLRHYHLFRNFKTFRLLGAPSSVDPVRANNLFASFYEGRIGIKCQHRYAALDRLEALAV